MKKILFLLLILSYLLSFAACATGNEVTENPEEKEEEKPKHVCDFSIASTDLRYFKCYATCTEPMQYYYSCTCRRYGTETFGYGDTVDHKYDVQVADERYMLKEANVKSPAIYYRTCQCGAVGEATFKYGSSLQLTEEQKLYLPTSITVTMYDTENSVYGFTYNSVNAPIDPAIQIKKIGDAEWTEYIPRSYEASTFDRDDNLITYFVSELEIELHSDTDYVYRVCDKGADIYTPEITLKAGNASTDSFTFAHLSDSQNGSAEFGQVLSSVSGNVDFVIHTGDVVENSKYEDEWTEMLDGNYESVAGIPIMAISGNHESTYKNGSYETDKHFHNNIPAQSSTALGYYYSFVYGDVKFIMLNTNDLTAENTLKAEQYDWLISELQSNSCKWTIVSMHNPMYSVGKYGADETRNAIALALRAQLGGVFAEYGVDLVLQGHDHAVSRTYAIDGSGVATEETLENIDGVEYIVDPSGVIYLMNGPAGTQAREPVAVDESLYAYAERGNKASWAEVTVTEDSLLITVKWYDGSRERVYQTWGIKKG